MPAWRAAAAPGLVALVAFAALALRVGAGDGFTFLGPVVAGARYVKPGAIVAGEKVHPGNGYDGQFSFALAQDPFLTRPATAASLDNTFRVRRLLYPLLAFVLAGGHRTWVAYSLVLINVAAGAVLGGLLAAAAAGAGRSKWWSLLAIAYPGVWIPLLLDLTEPLQLVLLAAGIMLCSAPLLLAAALAKETAGVALATQAIRAAAQRRWRPALVNAALAALFVAWALLVFVVVRGPAYNDLGGHFLDPPGAPFRLLVHPSLPVVIMIPALAVSVLALLRPVVQRDAASWAGSAYALLALGAGYDTWTDPAAYFRVTAGALVLVYLSWVGKGDRLGLAVLVAGLFGALLTLPILLPR